MPGTDHPRGHRGRHRAEAGGRQQRVHADPARSGPPGRRPGRFRRPVGGHQRHLIDGRRHRPTTADASAATVVRAMLSTAAGINPTARASSTSGAQAIHSPRAIAGATPDTDEDCRPLRHPAQHPQEVGRGQHAADRREHAEHGPQRLVPAQRRHHGECLTPEAGQAGQAQRGDRREREQARQGRGAFAETAEIRQTAGMCPVLDRAGQEEQQAGDDAVGDVADQGRGEPDRLSWSRCRAARIPCARRWSRRSAASARPGRGRPGIR